MERIKYFDGLRGIATLIVLANHIAAIFYPGMFSYDAANSHFRGEELFSTTPLFALINGQTAVIMFFILSGYLISYKFYSCNNRGDYLLSTAIRRYFTLLLPCLLSVIVGYILVKFSLTSAHKVNPNYTIWLFSPDLKNALYQGFWEMFRGSSNLYNVSLWTIVYEINGTLLVASFLALFGNFQKRYLLYILFILLSKKDFYSMLLICFIIGMAISDFKYHNKLDHHVFKKPLLHTILLVFGVLLSIYPVGLYNKHQYIFDIMQKASHNNDLVYRIAGASMIFFAIIISTKIQEKLSSRFLYHIGKVSFSIYVIHLAILGTVTSNLVLYLNKYLSYNYSALLSIAISFVLIYLCACFIHKYINLNGVKLTNYIYNKFLNVKKEEV